MRRILFSFILLLVLFINVTGCMPLIVGGTVGALGGYAISKDTIQGETDKSYNSLWDAALQVSRIRGIIKQENSARGYIELVADSSRVWIKLIRLTQVTTRLRVSSRNKYRLPNIALAQDIFVKIIEEAN